MLKVEVKDVPSIWAGIKQEISKVIVGQEHIVERLLMAISIGGHILVEGLPGNAKTLTIRLLAKVLNTNYSRIQFTPDLLPADITGTMIYNQKDGVFTEHKGPVFANIVIADEINRAPAKVQSALLQAMEEKSVTLGNNVHNLPFPFIVMATQNPIEQEGTFELPEAQLDRFLYKIIIKYPSELEEFKILSRVDNLTIEDVEPKYDLMQISEIGKLSTKVSVEDSIKQYIVDIVAATRKEINYVGYSEGYIEYGASPRASLAILRSARVQALLEGRNYVIPDDIKKVTVDILQHRIVLSFEALGSGIKAQRIISTILENVTIPK